jgi:hypothetical protein
MRWKFLLLSIITVSFFAACDKDKFNTKPSLEFKSINGNIIPSNGALVIQFEFTDKEGDISNVLYVKKIRTNQRQVPTIRDTFALEVPDFPKHSKGVIEAVLDHPNYLVSASNPPRVGNPPRYENDSLTLKFVLRDKAMNVSDTVTVENIIVDRN